MTGVRFLWKEDTYEWIDEVTTRKEEINREIEKDRLAPSVVFPPKYIERDYANEKKQRIDYL